MESNHISSADWMGELAPHVSSLKLHELIIPGTHDSGTSTLDPDQGIQPDHFLSGPYHLLIGCLSRSRKIILEWAQTQTMSISEQLHAGIRYFDFRLAYHPENYTLNICHGYYGAPINTILNDINDFLEKHPAEIVLLDFQKLHNLRDSDKQRFLNLLFRRLGTKMAPATMGVDITLQDLQIQGHQVIVFQNARDAICTDDRMQKLWIREKYLNSPWINSACTKKLKQGLKSAASNHLTCHFEKFFVLQGVLTPKISTVTLGFFGRHRLRSLADLADTSTHRILEWMELDQFEHQNIFIVDHCHKIDFMSAVIQLNLAKGQNKVSENSISPVPLPKIV